MQISAGGVPLHITASSPLPHHGGYQCFCGVQGISERWRDRFKKKISVPCRVRGSLAAVGLAWNSSRSEKQTLRFLPLHLTTHNTRRIVGIWISKGEGARNPGWPRVAGALIATLKGKSRNPFLTSRRLNRTPFTARRNGWPLETQSSTGTRYVSGAFLVVWQ